MKKNIKIIFIVLILFMFFSIKTVYAESEICKVELKPDKTELKPGDTVSIDIKLVNVTSEDGIVQIVGQLDYDQDIFEIVDVGNEIINEDVGLEDKKAESQLETLKVASYNEDEWFILLGEVEGADGALLEGETYGDSIVADEKIGTIKLKVKSTVSDTTTKINLSGIAVIDEMEETEELTSTANANLRITSKTNTPSGAEEPNTNKPVANANNEKENQGTKQEANQAAPYAGVEDVSLIIFVVAIITIITFIKVVKYKNIK